MYLFLKYLELFVTYEINASTFPRKNQKNPENILLNLFWSSSIHARYKNNYQIHCAHLTSENFICCVLNVLLCTSFHVLPCRKWYFMCFYVLLYHESDKFLSTNFFFLFFLLFCCVSFACHETWYNKLLSINTPCVLLCDVLWWVEWWEVARVGREWHLIGLLLLNDAMELYKVFKNWGETILNSLASCQIDPNTISFNFNNIFSSILFQNLVYT